MLESIRSELSSSLLEQLNACSYGLHLRPKSVRSTIRYRKQLYRASFLYKDYPTIECAVRAAMAWYRHTYREVRKVGAGNIDEASIKLYKRELFKSKTDEMYYAYYYCVWFLDHNGNRRTKTFWFGSNHPTEEELEHGRKTVAYFKSIVKDKTRLKAMLEKGVFNHWKSKKLYLES